MFASRYQRITTNDDNNDNNDNISSDDSILDMNNTNTSNIANNYNYNNNYNDNYEYDDNIPLLPNNNTSNTNIRQNRDRLNANQHQTRNQTRNQTQHQTRNHGLIIQSPTYRNYLIKQIIWNVFIITLFASIGLAFVICGFKETTNSTTNDIYNINAQYSFYYFSILLSFYIIYIGGNILTIIISFLASINGNTSIKILLLNGTLFQLTLIIKLFIMVILCVQLIDNTPMLILNVNISGVVNNTVVDVYIPKHIQYMIIEIIIYSCISYCIGYNNGMIRLL